MSASNADSDPTGRAHVATEPRSPDHVAKRTPNSPADRHATRLRFVACAFLLVQGSGGLAWWLVLLFHPGTRAYFVISDAPETTLMAFVAADLLLYVGGSLASAYGLWKRTAWLWPLLCVHAGAAAYAALYTLGLWVLDRRIWLPAVMMGPSLMVPPWLAWHARPKGKLAC